MMNREEFLQNKFICDGTKKQYKTLLAFCKKVKKNFDGHEFVEGIDSFLTPEKYKELEKGKTYEISRLFAKWVCDTKSNDHTSLFICSQCGATYNFPARTVYNLPVVNKGDKRHLVGCYRLYSDEGNTICKECLQFDSDNKYIPVSELMQAEFDCWNAALQTIVKVKKWASKYKAAHADKYEYLEREGFIFAKKDIVTVICYQETNRNPYKLSKFITRRPLRYITEYNSFDSDAIKAAKELGRIYSITHSGDVLEYKDGYFIFLKYPSRYIKPESGERKLLREYPEEVARILAENSFWATCQYCGDLVPQGVVIRPTIEQRRRFPGLNYDYLCNDCYNNNLPNINNILSYSTKFNHIIDAKKSFTGLKYNRGISDLYYGVEFEAYLRQGVKFADLAAQLGGYVFGKRDGSLSEIPGGVELVSAPATFEKCRQIWAALFDTKYARADSEDKTNKFLKAYEYASAGTHIHISRAPLRDLDIVNIVYFINNFTKFCAKIAGRDYYKNTYSRVKDLYISRDSSGAIKNPVRVAENCLDIASGHYDAVNLENSETVEIRIFKSNVTMSALFRYLEFVDSLVYYSKSKKALCFEEVTTTGYLKFIKGKARYKFLNDFIRKNWAFFSEFYNKKEALTYGK